MTTIRNYRNINASPLAYNTALNYQFSSQKMFLPLLSRNALFVIICLLAGTGFLSAQSVALEIETLIDTQAVTYGQAARFILEASEVFVTDSPEEAFNYAVQQRWLPVNVSANANARLDGISLLLMCSFEMRGGIFYSLTKNSHYAYLELVCNNVILGRHDPAMAVSGAKLLSYVGRILAMQGMYAQTIRQERGSESEDAATEHQSFSVENTILEN
jgi:hypothetical protein